MNPDDLEIKRPCDEKWGIWMMWKERDMNLDNVLLCT